MRKPKVLIVDDEAGIRSILSALLLKHGYEVQVCPSGESCLTIYPQFVPEVVLLARGVEGVTLARRVRQLENQLEETYGFDNIIGASDRMKSTFALMRRFAATDGTVLVCGESGTGKELIVRAIHQASRRRSGPFIVVNCGEIPASLIESEFFGHEAGSFTGATGLRRGKFEEADG